MTATPEAIDCAARGVYRSIWGQWPEDDAVPIYAESRMRKHRKEMAAGIDALVREGHYVPAGAVPPPAEQVNEALAECQADLEAARTVIRDLLMTHGDAVEHSADRNLYAEQSWERFRAAQDRARVWLSEQQEPSV